MSLYEMRRSYTLGTLLEKDIDPDPMVQFRRWLKEAGGAEIPEWVEINAMTLSTSDASGSLSSRVVLLKGLHDEKFWFYTNYQSQKARQMAENQRVALCFLWQHLQRQVRIEGTVAKAPREQSEHYFNARPRASQLGAVVSEQSSQINGREVLETRLTQFEKEFEGTDIPCPEHWGGYCVTPNRLEFWQGRESRLHDRLVYEKAEMDADDPQSDRTAWQISRLAP